MILGDLTFYGKNTARQLILNMPGRKIMVVGNHDAPIKSYGQLFERYESIMDMYVSREECPALESGMMLSLCHYPLLSWNRKSYGSIMLHGHCHGRLDEYNSASPDLRFDVGIDGALAVKYGGLIPAEAIYAEAMAKTGGITMRDYAMTAYDKNNC